jgi:hypothetical protein
MKNNARTSTKYGNRGDCVGNGGQWLALYSYLEKATSNDFFFSSK